MIGRRSPGRRLGHIALAVVFLALVGLALLGGRLLLAPPNPAATVAAQRLAIAQFELQREGGQPLRLADLRGKAILLNIWATWCLSCRTEMPSLDRLQRRMGGNDFEVVALSIDRDGAEVVKPFYAQFGIKNLAIYLDREGKAIRSFKIAGLPTTLLLDPDGAEVLRWVGPKEWDSPELIADISRHIPELSKPGNRDARP